VAAVAALVVYSLGEEREQRQRDLVDRVVRSCTDVVDRSVPAAERVEKIYQGDTYVRRRTTTTATRRDGGKAEVVYEQEAGGLFNVFQEANCDVR
jgi:hypothetical protein